VSECEICGQENGHHIQCPDYYSSCVEQQNSELAALRTENAELHRLLTEAQEAVILSDAALIPLRTKLEGCERHLTDAVAGIARFHADKLEAERKLTDAEQEREEYRADSIRLLKEKMDLWEIVHFPGGIEAQKAQARAEGLEEAAKVCAENGSGRDSGGYFAEIIRAKMKEGKP